MKPINSVILLMACVLGIQSTLVAAYPEDAPADRAQIAQQLQATTACLSNALLCITESSLKSEKVNLFAFAQEAQRFQEQAISNLNATANTTLKWHERSYIVVKQADGSHCTFDFWKAFSTLRSIKMRDSRNSLVFDAAFHTNGVPRSFSSRKPERLMEFYATGRLKRLSLSVHVNSYYEVQWTEDGKIETEAEFTPRQRSRE
jgi:hypothetical protein